MFYPGYRVALAEEERARLTKMTSSGKTYARALTHARILLKCDRGPYGPRFPNAEIAEALGCSELTVWRVKKAYVEEGLEAALFPKSSGPRASKLDGEQEAKLVALACSKPPEGRAVWTMQMLADKLVELEIVDAISDETVRVTLKKNQLKPWQKKQWVIPPESNGAFVAAMEDVLDVYKRPYDPLQPVVCFDESNKQLVGDYKEPLPPAPGQPAKINYGYERKGVANIFMAVESLAGKRFVEVTEHRCIPDFAEQIRKLIDERYPLAEKVVLVMENSLF